VCARPGPLADESEEGQRLEVRRNSEWLAAMGIEIDVLTPEQEAYLSSWESGT